MSTYHCRCGCSFHLQGDGDYEFILINRGEMILFEEKMDDKSVDGDDMENFLFAKGQVTYRCPECKRVYLYDVINGKEVLYVYNVEEILRDEPEDEAPTR